MGIDFRKGKERSRVHKGGFTWTTAPCRCRASGNPHFSATGNEKRKEKKRGGLIKADETSCVKRREDRNQANAASLHWVRTTALARAHDVVIR